jgi:hypothetical protein
MKSSHLSGRSLTTQKGFDLEIQIILRALGAIVAVWFVKFPGREEYKVRSSEFGVRKISTNPCRGKALQKTLLNTAIVGY